MDIAKVSGTIEAPIDQVWAVITGFGNIKALMPGIKTAALEGFGIGSVRTIQSGGPAPIKERLEECDAKAHRLSYSVVEPHPLPLKNARATMQLKSLGSDRTQLDWWLAADEAKGSTEAVSQRITGMYSAGLEGIKKLVA